MKKRLYVPMIVLLCTLGVFVLLALAPGNSMAGELVVQDRPLTLSLPGTPVPNAKAARAMQTLPDLVIESIVYHPPQPVIGQSVNITITVKNQGDAAASGFYTHLYVNPVEQPPDVNTPYTSRTFWGIPLNPGASFQWVRTGHTFAEDGLYPVYAWVDRDNAITESDETNNLAGPINICVGGGCVQPDMYEPDNLCSQANPITTDGVAQARNLYPTPDKDWVWFTAIGGVTYHIQAIADGADADLVIELHGTCSSPPSFGSGAEIIFTAPADGTYYAKVEHIELDYGPDTAYRLKVTAQNNCSGYHEPNNTCVTAGHMIVGQPAQLHSFCAAGDEDWISFQTEAGATYTVSATNIGSNSNVQLGFAATCTDAPTDGGQYIEYTATNAGTVFVRARNSNSQQFGPDTEYHLQVVQTQSCTPDVFENDDTPDTARLLLINGAVQRHNFCPAGEVDWVRFDVTAGSEYTIETFSLGSAADTVLCLYDGAGAEQLACDDDSGEGLGSRITWQATTSGTYTARVMHYDPTVAGPTTHYSLRIITGPCVPDSAEPDNNQATARLINADGSLHPRNTCPAGDEDWFAFNVNAGSYVMETTDLGVGADTIIELYDINSNRLAFNDDYGPGEASRIHYVFGTAGTYFLKVRQFNPHQHGIGTEYSVRVIPGTPPTPTPTLSPTPPPTVTPTPPAAPSGVNTLILVNRERLAALHGETATAQLMARLDALATHPRVNGEIVRLDLNHTIGVAYANWVVDYNNVDKANSVAASIRGVIMTYLQQLGGIEYVVLVGDDRVIPFRRIVDNTPRLDFLERHYLLVTESHPTGAAMRANHFLTDDYYVARNPIPFLGRELYLPDLAIGRLIETPSEMIAFIDIFLAGDELHPERVLVTGYDFVQDTATANCSDWQAVYGNASVDCTLIGNFWPLSEFRAHQLNAVPPFKLQSINGHADHFREGAPGFGNHISAQEIASSVTDLSRGLIYTLGCHSGLNVPPSNVQGPLDLAQAFTQKGANYVGNTGYGWGSRSGIALSERLMRLYTEELQSTASVSMGQALALAKQRYYQEGQNFSGYDEKILQESVFYGLPMYHLVTANPTALSTSSPFPSVDLISNLPGSSFGSDAVISGTVSISLIGALGPGDIMEMVLTDDGVFYKLDGYTSVAPDQPIQPLFFADVGVPGWGARSVVFKGGSYETVVDFDPVVVAPINDYITQTVEPLLSEDGWYPSLPLSLQNIGDRSSLVAQLGQYNTLGQEMRLYSALDLDLYYSLSADHTPPIFGAANAVYNRGSNLINMKVSVMDESGVARVIVVYTDGNGVWNSLDLSFDPLTHKWHGSFTGGAETQYFVQAVDSAGNTTVATNKGRYFTPIPGLDLSTHAIFLPMLVR